MPPGISLSDFYYITPELVLTGGALLLLIADVALPRAQRAALAWIALLVLGVTALSLIPFASTRVEVAHGLLAVDQFALFFKVLFLGAAAITVLMSIPYLKVEGASPGEYYFLILCATLGMMIMAGGIDLISIFIGLETMAVSFYILAGFIKPSQRSNEAAVKYFLLGAFSLGILLYGMSLMYGLSGTTNLRVMAAAFRGQEHDPRLVLAVILVVAGVGFKIAAVPFHMWAPDVYEGAPTPVTAFLSVGSKAASFAMLIRIFVEGLPTMGEDWRLLFWILAVLTMTAGNIAAVTQSNIKRMLAYSSIAHAGYLLVGVVAGTSRGITAMLVYLFIYSFMQLGAFAVVVLLRRADVIGDELKDFQRAELPLPVCGVRDAGVHAVARRDSADGRVHGQAVVVWCGHRRAVLLAGRDHGAEQYRVALLLRPRGGLHVSEEGRGRLGADARPVAGAGARHRGPRNDRPGRVSAAAVRPGGRVRENAWCGWSYGRPAIGSWRVGG